MSISSPAGSADERRRVELDASGFRIAQLCLELWEDVSIRARERSNVVYWDVEPGDLVIATDRGKLKRCLAALLDNAVKLTASGEVRLLVKRVGEDEIQFAVAHTGHGIESIFLPFTHAGAGYARSGGGRGFDLTIARALATSLEARLNVDSEIDNGSVFTLAMRTRPT